jgi:hypothetical protein
MMGFEAVTGARGQGSAAASASRKAGAMRADLESRLQAVAAARGTTPEALLDEILTRELHALEIELAYERALAAGGHLQVPAGRAPEPEHLDAIVPAGLRAIVAERAGWWLRGRGYVPEPKAPRLFRARHDDVEVASQIAFGPEAGPTLAVSLPDGRHAWTDVVMPLRWIVVDMVPAGWHVTLDAAEDAARHLRAGEEVPPRYGTDAGWGYPLPIGDGAGKA